MKNTPKSICAYPIAGWMLDQVKFDERKGEPDGWIVALKREGNSWMLDRRSFVVMARSDVGPLEAWDEALRIVQREDAREAERDKLRAQASDELAIAAWNARASPPQMEICDECNGAGGDNQHTVCGKCGGTGGYYASSTHDVAEEIAAERRLQIEAEGYTPEHDDQHAGDELARAAACYAIGTRRVRHEVRDSGGVRGCEDWCHLKKETWPWDDEWWKPHISRRRQLIKVGALIIAEIERLDRRSALTEAKTGQESAGESATGAAGDAQTQPPSGIDRKAGR